MSPRLVSRSALVACVLLVAATVLAALTWPPDSSSPKSPAASASAASDFDASASAASASAESTSETVPEVRPRALNAEAASSSSALEARLNRLLDRWQGDRTFWGAYVQDLSSGETLFSRNAGHAFVPASNQKILTTATALDALGATHRYETTLRFDGTVGDSVLTGDLIIDGSGDPTFGSTELSGPDPLQEWAERLAEMGVTRVEGRLIGDDRGFSGRPYPEGWDVDYITRQAGRYMGTSAGALSYRDNVVEVRTWATRPGRPPSVRVRPADAIEIDNQAMTSGRRRGSSLLVNRTFATNTLRLTGSVPRTYRGTVNVPVSDPTMFTLQAFRAELQAAGIATDVEMTSIGEAGRVGTGRTFFVETSPPLADVLAVVNKKSNNFYAEQVFRTYGWGGSSRGGGRRTERFLRRVGVNSRRVTVSDGSGLSRKDLITPQAMVGVLAAMHDHAEAEAFRASLPRGGENNTTLEYRLHRVPVRAKTGSLQFVRALSGYARRPDGTDVAFALFANNYTGPSYQITRTMDDVVRELTTTTAR